MKKKLIKTIITAALPILIAVGAVILINYDRAVPRTSVDLYFLNEDRTGIISEQRTIKYRDDAEKIGRTLEALKKGPKSSGRGKIISNDTEIQRVVLREEERVVVDFSDTFLTGDTSIDVLSTYAVIKTLCSTGSVSEVEVTVNGNPVKDRDGNEIDFISASDINLETEDYVSEMKEVPLYFADKAEKTLVRETRKIRITDLQPTAVYIINELIKGTDNDLMKSLLSDKTQLISVDVDSDICYLNFKASFISDNAGSDEHNRLVIYSIVNSLTEAMDITRVQFYMDGKRVERFGSVYIKDYIGAFKTEGD